MNKHAITGIIIVLIAAGAYFAYTNGWLTTELRSSTLPSETAETTSSSVLKTYESAYGYSLKLPKEASAAVSPPTEIYSEITVIEGDFGVLCISSGYGCGGKGLQGWGSGGKKTITTIDGTTLDTETAISDEGRGNRIYIGAELKPPFPRSWTADGQIQFQTTKEHLATAEAMLKSLTFK